MQTSRCRCTLTSEAWFLRREKSRDFHSLSMFQRGFMAARKLWLSLQEWVWKHQIYQITAMFKLEVLNNTQWFHPRRSPVPSTLRAEERKERQKIRDVRQRRQPKKNMRKGMERREGEKENWDVINVIV